jgi:hypothetical protein
MKLSFLQIYPVLSIAACTSAEKYNPCEIHDVPSL